MADIRSKLALILVTPQLEKRGGIETHTIELARSARRLSYQVSVVCHHGGCVPDVSSLLGSEGITLLERAGTTDFSSSEFRSRLALDGIPLLIVLMPYSRESLELTKRIRDKGMLVASLEPGDATDPRRWLGDHRWLQSVPEVVDVVLAYDCEYAEAIHRRVGIPIDVIRVVPTMTHAVALPVEHNAPIVGFAGRVVRDKGIAEFLELAASIPECLFRVFGRLDETPEDLLALLRRSPSNVQVCGEYRVFSEIAGKATVFCFPSQYEGFGIVRTEALAAGRVVVTTRTGPLHRLVQRAAGAIDGDLSVRVGDQPALTQSVLTAIDTAMRLPKGLSKRNARVGKTLFGPTTGDQSTDTLLAGLFSRITGTSPRV